MKREILLIAALLIILLAVAACNEFDPPLTQPPEDIETDLGIESSVEESQEPAKEVFLDGVSCPLGGETIERSSLYKRPVAVMLDNHPAARPQAGLEQAEVVYEILAEGSITRYMAVFMHGDDQLVGPVRSARSYYIDKSMEHNAIYLHAGGSPGAWDDIARLKIPSFNAMIMGEPLYWREKHRKKPHNVYTSLDRIQASAEDRGYNKTEGVQVHFFNEEDIEIDGAGAKKVIIEYPQNYRVSYQYSSDDGVYLRYVLDKPHVDENNTNYQLEAKNIIVQAAAHRVVDSEGRRNVSLVGSGKGMYITNGSWISITWEKDDRGVPTRFYYEDGTQVKLNPGKTWIQVVPALSGVTFE